MVEKFSEVTKILAGLTSVFQSDDFNFMDNEFDSIRNSLVRVLQSSRLYASALKPDVHGSARNFGNLFVAVTILAQNSVSLTVACRSEPNGKEAWIKYYAKLVEKFSSIEKSLNTAKQELASGHTLFPTVLFAANTIQTTLHLIEDATTDAHKECKRRSRHYIISAVCLWFLLNGAIWLVSFCFRANSSRNDSLSVGSVDNEIVFSPVTDANTSYIAASEMAHSSYESNFGKLPIESVVPKVSEDNLSPKIITGGLSDLGLLAITGFSTVAFIVHYVQRKLRQKRMKSADEALVVEIEGYAQHMKNLLM